MDKAGVTVTITRKSVQKKCVVLCHNCHTLFLPLTNYRLAGDELPLRKRQITASSEEMFTIAEMLQFHGSHPVALVGFDA